MSQHSGKGRRTPLTLGQQQHHHQQQHHNSHKNAHSSGARKGSSDSTQSDVSRNASGAKPSSDSATTATVHLTDQIVSGGGGANVTHVVGPKSAQLKAKQKQHRNNTPTAIADDGDVILIADDNDDSSDASSKRASSKSERRADKTAKNGSSNNGNSADATNNGNGKVQLATAVPASPKSQQIASGETTGIAESPRQKVLRENREKDEAERAKQQEAREIEAALAAFQAQEEQQLAEKPVLRTPEKSAKRPTDKQTPAGGKASPVVSSNNSTPKKSTPVKATQKSPQAAPPAVVADGNVAAAESDDAMESLQMEPEVEEPQPPAAKTPAAAALDTPSTIGGKILKYSLSPTVLLSRSRLSPFAARRRSIEATAGADNASTLVNLSTVSEQSNECHSGIASPAIGAAGGDNGKQLFGSLRHISGRRSTRPLREVALLQQQSSASGTYRRTRTELDDANNASISSMNVTVGSERDCDSIRSRKRTTAQLGGSEPDLTTGAVETPKKARLDLSGIFGILASPVTLLRNKFSRANLLCSTPNAKKLIVDVAEDDEVLPEELEKVDAENVEEVLDDIAEKQAVEEIPAVAADDVVVIEAHVPMEDDDKPTDRTDLEAQIAADVTIAGAVGDGCDESIVVQEEAAKADNDNLNEAENDTDAATIKPKKTGCSVM